MTIMNTPSTATDTFVTVNLAKATWTEGGRRARFASSKPAWGVVETATGRALASDGVTPSTWRSRTAARMIAEFPPAWPTVAVEVVR